MIETKLENKRKRFHTTLSAVMFGVAFGLGACSDNSSQNNAQKATPQETGNAAPASNETPAKANEAEDTAAAKEPVTAEKQAALGPADAIRSILKPDYRLKLSYGNTVVFNGQAGQTTDSGDLVNKSGDKQGHVSLLTKDGRLVILDDESMLPEEGFAFLPYYENTGGTASLLMLGLFQVKGDDVRETDVVDVDDHAEFTNLEYLGEGQYLLHALIRGPEQSPAEAPNVPMQISFQRSDDKMIDRQTKVSGLGEQGAAKGQPTDEQGVNDQSGHALPGLTDNGLGPLTAGSRYDADSLLPYADGLTETYDVTHTDSAQTAFGEVSSVKLSGQTGAIKATYLKGGALVSIDVTLPDIATADNVALGDKMAGAMTAHEGTSTCGTGLEELSGSVVCVFDGMNHLATVFKGPTPDNAPDGWLPEPGSAEADQWVAVRHIWFDNPMAHLEPFER